MQFWRKPWYLGDKVFGKVFTVESKSSNSNMQQICRISAACTRKNIYHRPVCGVRVTRVSFDQVIENTPDGGVVHVESNHPFVCSLGVGHLCETYKNLFLVLLSQ